MATQYDASMLNELLSIYYNRLFPYDTYMKWINGSGQVPVDKQYVSKREFSFKFIPKLVNKFNSNCHLSLFSSLKLPHLISEESR